MANNMKVGIFLAVTFAFSWLIALAIHLGGGLAGLGSLATFILLTYMAGPMIGALVCVFAFEKGRRLDALGLKNPKWRAMPLAWLAAVALMLGALLITILVPGYGLGDPIAANKAIIADLPETMLSEAEREMSLATLDRPGMAWIIGGASLFLGPAINTVLTLTEELGWRGYLWDQLKSRGFWPTSLMTGLLWGVWHMPIIWLGHNYPDAPILGSFAFIGLCVLMSPLYSWIRIKTDSVWGAGLLHGTTNATAGYFILWQTPITMPWTGFVGIGGYIAATLSLIVIALLWRRAPLPIR